MIGRATVLLLFVAATFVAAARADPAWTLHTRLEGDSTPSLCKDTNSVELVVAVLAHAIAAQAASDDEKAKRLFALAAKLQDEICLRPTKDDIVILRCNLERRQIGKSAISLIKVSALLHSDVSAGEQPFYAWTYANIAGGDDSDADAQEANKKWCGKQTVADATLDPTPDLVQRIQERLYDFGLYMPHIDGTLNQETTQALILFQKWAGLQPTGQLTQLTVEKIDSTNAPQSWIAAAYDAFGKNVMLEADTRRVAEEKAADALRRKSKGEYKVLSAAYPDCLALSSTSYKHRRTTYGETFAIRGSSEPDAKSKALDYCNSQKSGGTCKLTASLCPAGTSQPRYDPENIPANSPAPSASVPRYDPKNISINAAPPPQTKRYEGGEPVNGMAPN
jgi:Putative peptidoglycan binding domain